MNHEFSEIDDISSFKVGIQEEAKKVAKSKTANDLRPRVWCNKLKMSFLVDSGAAVSIIPRSRVKDVTPSEDVKLRAVNGSTIQTYGKRTFRLQFGRAHFTHTFVVADLPGVLGFDWMSQHGIHLTWTGDGKCKLSTGRKTIPVTMGRPSNFKWDGLISPTPSSSPTCLVSWGSTGCHSIVSD